jgi:putative flippase GtrA
VAFDEVSATGHPRHRREPQPGRLDRQVVTQLVKFGLNGLVTAVAYSAVVWTLIAVSHKTFALDVVVAYAVSSVCNYIGARWVFKPTDGISGHIGRYVTVVACGFTLTTVLAWLIHKAGVPDLVGAYLPVLITAVPTFLAMRFWVFNSPKPAS